MFFFCQGVPVHCGNCCYCHYYEEVRTNVYNCSSASLHELPSNVPNNTNWIVMRLNKIKGLCTSVRNFEGVWSLDFKGNEISYICNNSIDFLDTNQQVKWLNLAQNNLARIPDKIQELKQLERIWLSGNPFHFDCKMIWMIGWLNNFTLHSGQHVIFDYQEVKCHSGKMAGMPIYVLNDVTMGCYPSKLTVLQEVAIGAGSGAGGIIILILLVLIIRRSRSFRFFIFYKLKIHSILRLNEEDDDENVENMEYDAYLSYR